MLFNATSNNFIFKTYKKEGLPSHFKTINQNFLEWFIGFFEAEGSFCQWFDGKKQRLQIEINQKDPKLMYVIKKKLGFGNVTQFKKSHTQQIYWRYQTSKRQNLERFIYLFNGNLVTKHKLSQFTKFLEEFNLIYKANFIILLSQPKVSLQTAWLAGFLEGDGGFWACQKKTKTQKKLKTGLIIKFYLTQKNALSLLNQLKSLFAISSKIYSLTNGHSNVRYNRLETTYLNSLLKIKTYLEEFPFYGQRQILVKRWCRLIDYKIKDYALTSKSIQKLERLVLATKRS
jgi:hypothetical protein